MSVNLLFVPSEALGYGRLGVKLAEELGKRMDVYPKLSQYEGAPTSKLVCWVSVPSHAEPWWKGQHAAIFTMWETTKLPEAFRENLHQFDTVLVPSTQNVELFSQYHDNVKLVTLGVDAEDWKFRERMPVEDEFRFLVAGSGPRKGTDLVYKAFMTLWGKDGSWGNGPVPKLIMKNPKGEDFYGRRVQMVSGRIGNAEEIELYAYAHCYVQPSRGEGFGLQPLQAIAQGCPTILTDAHGHASFAHLGRGIGAGLSDSDYFIFGDAGEWWEPNFDELVDQMRYVYEHYEKCAGDAVQGSVEAHERFTWSNVADQFVGSFPAEVFGEYEGPWEKVDLDPKLYRVRTSHTRHLEVAGQQYLLQQGEDYWLTADVKRILFENGALDPDCIDDDSGLTEKQIREFGLDPAKYARCPTCDRPL